MAPTLKSLLALAFALPLAFAAPTSSKVRRAADDKDVIPGKFIVVFADGVSASSIEAHRVNTRGLSKRDGDPVVVNDLYDLDEFKGYAVEADDASIEAIAASDEVAYVEPDHWVYASAITTQSSAPWGLGRISNKAKGSTTYRYDSTAGAGTFAYIIDTGILASHTQFGGRAIAGTSFVSGQTVDGHGHGTHVAGTIGSSTYGVAKAATLIGVKVLADDGRGQNSATISGLQWVVTDARARGATSKSVVNLSLGGVFSSATNTAIRSVYNAGITVVVAAGNEDQDASNVSPASEPLAITVGASDAGDLRSIWGSPFASNFGSVVDVFAPGTNILSTWVGSNSATRSLNGTSMASPHVAGLAAYLIGLEGLSTPAAVTSRIVALAQKNILGSNLRDSPNVLVYNGNGA